MSEEIKDIRWKQRFQNFEKAFRLLDMAIQIELPSDTERAGVIQFFEMAFELAWRLLKDYLEEEGYVMIESPRDAIKQASQSKIIDDGHTWIDALKDRNLTVHAYHEEMAVAVENKIHNDYYPILQDLYNSFKRKIETE